MPIPVSISDLNVTAALNSPAGSDSLNTTDDYIRALSAIIKTQDDAKNTAIALKADASTVALKGANTDITSLGGLTGDVQTSGATAKIGYKAGAGAIYTQSGSKTSNVAVTTRTGVITTVSATSIPSNGKITFLVTNAGITNNDHALVSLRGGFANQENYSVYSRATSGGFQVILWNTSGGALAEAVEVLYTIVSGSAT